MKKPLTEVEPKFPTHGVIRLGIKTERGMKAIDTFRFTSPDEAAIHQLAELYGGQPQPWYDKKANPQNQFEVITQATEIAVLIYPGSVKVSYELWSGRGLQRRCDGTSCELFDDRDSVVPCICNERGVEECADRTTLDCLLPAVRFGGRWRLFSKGYNAFREMPAMARVIEELAGEGRMLRAMVRLEHRIGDGGAKKFVVPVLSMPVTPDEIVSGHAQLAAVSQPQPLALESGDDWDDDWDDDDPGRPFTDDDDQVVDAEVVSDNQVAEFEADTWVEQDLPPEDERVTPATRSQLMKACREITARSRMEHADIVRHWLCWRVSNQRTRSSKNLTEAEAAKIIAANESGHTLVRQENGDLSWG